MLVFVIGLLALLRRLLDGGYGYLSARDPWLLFTSADC